MRDHSATVAGVRLHWVELEGPSASGSGPPLLLFHGLNDSHLTWRSVAPELARSRRVLVPDLPGHGLSGRPDASYELHWYADVMASWLDHLGLETVDVAGHSFGGGVAQVMLLDCSSRMRRLALISSGGLGREIAVALRLASLPIVIERFGQPFMSLGTLLALKTAGYAFAEDIANLCEMNAQPGSARVFARTVRDIINWRGQRRTFFQRAHELASLPALAVFWGERDAIIPLSHALALTQAVEGVRLYTFRKCGHYVHHQDPRAFVRALLEFLDDPDCPAARLAPRLARRVLKEDGAREAIGR